MNLIEEIMAIEKNAIDKKNVSITVSGKILTIEVEFIKSGESIYATCNRLNLVSGSQKLDSEMAKMKALMRLISKILHKISTLKKYDAIESIFAPGVTDSQLLSQIKDFSTVLESETESSLFNVLEEDLSMINPNLYKYSRKKISEVTDPRHVQEAKMELLTTTQTTELTITESPNNWVNLAFSKAS